jgi:hypothetical protein
MADRDPHVSTTGDPVETLRALAGQVDRAVSVAMKVREEVEPALSAVEYPAVPPVIAHE